MSSSVVGGGTSTLVNCNGRSVVGSVSVQRFKASATCSKVLRVVSPATKLGVVNDSGLVRSERIFMFV